MAEWILSILVFLYQHVAMSVFSLHINIVVDNILQGGDKKNTALTPGNVEKKTSTNPVEMRPLYSVALFCS